MCKKNTDWLPLVYPQPRTQQQPRHVPKLVTFLLAGLYSTTEPQKSGPSRRKVKNKKTSKPKTKTIFNIPREIKCCNYKRIGS